MMEGTISSSLFCVCTFRRFRMTAIRLNDCSLSHQTRMKYTLLYSSYYIRTTAVIFQQSFVQARRKATPVAKAAARNVWIKGPMTAALVFDTGPAGATAGAVVKFVETVQKLSSVAVLTK
jgi:hypothetical protein